MDDRLVDVVRRAAETTRKHAVFVSKGTLDRAANEALCSLLPEPFGRRLLMAPDSLELVDDLVDAENLAEMVALAMKDVPLGFGVHALLARRDGTVDLVMPRSVSTVRSQPFPGFADAA
jgi:hypothetical protein